MVKVCTNLEAWELLSHVLDFLVCMNNFQLERAFHGARFGRRIAESTFTAGWIELGNDMELCNAIINS